MTGPIAEVAGALFALLVGFAPSGVTPGVAPAARPAPERVACSLLAPPLAKRAAPARAAAEPPAYYAVELVTTKNIPGTGLASGTAHLTFAPSPFGVALAPDGSFVYEMSVELSRMKAPREGVLVAWATTPEVDRIVRLGALDDRLTARGPVSWNKFLVVVTLESSDRPDASTWAGPIVMRGMSRSGMMHTMAGHGPFQKELCAKYGY